jgi:hypothetical protein
VTGVSGTGNKVEASRIDVTGIKSDQRSSENIKVHGDAGLVGGKHTFKDNAAGIQNFKGTSSGTSSSSDSEDAKKKKLHQKLSFCEKKYSSNPEELKKKLLEISNEYEELEDYEKASELLDRANKTLE